MAIRIGSSSEMFELSDNKFIYQDVYLDLVEEELPTSSSLYNKSTQSDIKASFDEAAVMNSLKNIFTTTPGEKILNPSFGVNLTQWLFNPLSEFNGTEIGEAIIAGIETFEPRVLVNNVNVIVDSELSQYEIKLVLTIPSLSIVNRAYDAILNQPGFDFLTHSPI